MWIKNNKSRIVIRNSKSKIQNSLLSYARQTLSDLDIKPRKRLGQNFLVDKAISRKIITSADLTPNDIVLEIGSGMGVLTSEIAPQVCKLIAIEIDTELVKALRWQFSNYENVDIIDADILKCDLDKFLSNYSNVKVIANLPYYITTPIIAKLLSAKKYFSSLIIMVQKEVAERMLSKPGSKRYGTLSVFVQFHANVKQVALVSKNCFFPRPKVSSIVLNLTILHEPAVKVDDEAFFFKIVKAGFATRRKMLINALVENSIGEKDELLNVFNQIKFDPQRRAEDLSLEEFALISKVIKAHEEHRTQITEI